MFRCLSTLVLFASLAVQADDCGGSDYGQAGVFDFYVFAQSWSAEFCASHSSDAGCKSPTPVMRSSLTIHGLWPNYDADQNGHWWPQCCSSQYGSGLNQTAINLLLAPLHTSWPDEAGHPWPNYTTSSFWAHEWGKHGTCSGLDQYTYFDSVLQVDSIIGTPSIISQNLGGQISLSALRAAYTSSNCVAGSSCLVGFSCTSGYLAEVTTCWTPDLQPMACPWAVLQADKCGSTVKIRSF